MARRDDLHSKAEYIAADLSIAPKLFPCSPAADHTFSGTDKLRVAAAMISVRGYSCPLNPNWLCNGQE